jgi:hypothetical protein
MKTPIGLDRLTANAGSKVRDRSRGTDSVLVAARPRFAAWHDEQAPGQGQPHSLKPSGKGYPKWMSIEKHPEA